MSPTELTLKTLREDRWTAQVVERWNQYAKIRQDLFGGIDVLACRALPPPDSGTQWASGIVGIQACAAASHSARRAKLLREPRLATWLAAGGQLEVWSWSTRRSEERTRAGKRSKRLVHHLRREEIVLSMFLPNQPAEQPREAMT